MTTAKRLPAVADIPTVNEFVPGYEATGARLASLGVEPMINTPAGFGKFIAQETEKWGKVIKSAGIKPE